MHTAQGRLYDTLQSMVYDTQNNPLVDKGYPLGSCSDVRAIFKHTAGPCITVLQGTYSPEVVASSKEGSIAGSFGARYFCPRIFPRHGPGTSCRPTKR